MSQSYTLEDLLNTLEKKASDEEMTPKEKAAAKAKEDAEEVEDGEKSKAEASKEEKGQEKSASEAGAALAKEVFEKVAHIKKDNEMNKQASYAGKALADAILTKLASAGDLNTDNGIPAGVTPNKIQQDAALLKAQDDAKYQALPGTDGAGNGGDVNQIFDSIVQDAMSEGATSYDQVQTGGASAGEGQATAQGSFIGQNPVDDSQEKMAACLTLVENGMDFDDAVELVKQAEEAIWEEEDGQIKQAAVGELIEQGFDFDTAVELVKQAVANPSERVSHPNSTLRGKADQAAYQGGQKVKNMTSGAVAKGRELAHAAKGHASSAYAGLKDDAGNLKGAVRSLGKSPRMALSSIAGNRLARGAAAVAGVAGLAGGAYALGREKKAAFEALVDAGVDFEKAAELVAAKSLEIYGV